MNPADLTWESLTGVIALATFLSVVVGPLAKVLGAQGRAVLAIVFSASVVVAQVAFVLTVGTARGAADAFLVGLLAAALASGFFETKKAIANQ